MAIPIYIVLLYCVIYIYNCITRVQCIYQYMRLRAAAVHTQCTPSGLTLHLSGYDSILTDGSGRILITDIGLVDAGSLLCQSNVTTDAGNANWYLHPTQLSTAVGDRILDTDPRGWSRNRAINSIRHRLVRLKRHSIITAREGVFTCHIVGDSNTPISVGIYYPSESLWTVLCIYFEAEPKRSFTSGYISVMQPLML